MLDKPAVPLFPEPSDPALQWPTEKQIAGVSKQLARIAELGIRSEASGDYFKSGDLAYQIQEIIRSTGELLRRSERTKE